jgi:hypothetical protein
MPVIPALGKRRQEDTEFKVSLSYVGLKNKTKHKLEEVILNTLTIEK